jgi:hypothetical protein
MATYTYNPGSIGVVGKDRMRFELGDVMVDNNGANAAISDEEIDALLTAYPNWSTAKLKIVESIYRRFSYEVSMSISGMRLDLQQRVEHWKQMYDDLRKAGASAPSVPGSQVADPEPYFYTGMMDNPGTRG